VGTDLHTCLKHDILQHMQHAIGIAGPETAMSKAKMHNAPAADQACIDSSAKQRLLINECGLCAVCGHSCIFAAAPHLVEPSEATAVQECLACTAAEVERQRGTHARKEYLQQRQQQAEAGRHQSWLMTSHCLCMHNTLHAAKAPLRGNPNCCAIAAMVPQTQVAA
jgi:hypothetical protein